jgi:hypothetical protein
MAIPAGVRRQFLSRGVVVLFSIQLALLIATLAEPLHGMATVTIPVTAEAKFINGFTDLLFAPGYDGLWDPLATILVLPFVYYTTAVVVSALGRAIYRSSRQFSP